MSDVAAARSGGNAELAVLVDLEARWENLRAGRTSSGPSSLQDLHANQRAYESFHARLVAYNKRHLPLHVPELLINTSARLEHWCRKMSGLFVTLAEQTPLPTHLLEKAYRLADGIATRRSCAPAARPGSGEPRDAGRELDLLAQWCAELAAAAAAA